MIQDLQTLKDQYEQVNTDQANKIEAYEEDVNDFREKWPCWVACREMQQENELLNYHLHNAANIQYMHEHKDEDTISLNKRLVLVVRTHHRQQHPKHRYPHRSSNKWQTRGLSVNEDEENMAQAQQLTTPSPSAGAGSGPHRFRIKFN